MTIGYFFIGFGIGIIAGICIAMWYVSEHVDSPKDLERRFFNKTKTGYPYTVRRDPKLTLVKGNKKDD